MTKVFAAAAQGCTAALVAAILSAMCEPLVNRPGPCTCRILPPPKEFAESLSEAAGEAHDRGPGLF